MNKHLITLAVLALAAVACDPYKDPPSGTPAVISAVITGRNAGLENLLFAGWPDNSVGPYDGELVGDTWTNFANADGHGATRSPSGTTGRILVFTTNRLLDGASVEQTPNSCLPVTSANWTFTVPGIIGNAIMDPTRPFFIMSDGKLTGGLAAGTAARGPSVSALFTDPSLCGFAIMFQAYGTDEHLGSPFPNIQQFSIAYIAYLH